MDDDEYDIKCDVANMIETVSNNSGITPLKAIKEFSDNSIDNGAKQIALIERATVDDRWGIADNGSGMTLSATKDAFIFAHKRSEVKEGRIGKFGFGLNTSVHYLSTDDKRITKTYLVSSTGQGEVVLAEYTNHMGKNPKLKLAVFNTTEELQDKYKSININEGCLEMMPRLDKSGTTIIFPVIIDHWPELRCSFNKEVPTIIPKRHERMEATYPRFFGKGGKI